MVNLLEDRLKNCIKSIWQHSINLEQAKNEWWAGLQRRIWAEQFPRFCQGSRRRRTWRRRPTLMCDCHEIQQWQGERLGHSLLRIWERVTDSSNRSIGSIKKKLQYLIRLPAEQQQKYCCSNQRFAKDAAICICNRSTNSELGFTETCFFRTIEFEIILVWPAE